MENENEESKEAKNFKLKTTEWKKSKKPVRVELPNQSHVPEVVLEDISILSLNVLSGQKADRPVVKLINCDIKREIEVNIPNADITFENCLSDEKTHIKFKLNTVIEKFHYFGEGHLILKPSPQQFFQDMIINGNDNLKLTLHLSGNQDLTQHFADIAIIQETTIVSFKVFQMCLKGSLDISKCTFDGHLEIDEKSEFKSKVKWPNHRSFKKFNSETIGNYRRLKQNAQKRANRKDGQLFWALELRNQRMLTSFFEAPFSKTLSFLYDAISAYGLSAGRAIFTLLALILVFGISLAIARSETPLFQVNSQLDMALILESTVYSLKQVAIPFSSLKTEESSLLKIISSVFTIISLGVVTLAILAIRGTFKQ